MPLNVSSFHSMWHRVWFSCHGNVFTYISKYVDNSVSMPVYSIVVNAVRTPVFDSVYSSVELAVLDLTYKKIDEQRYDT
jgi:hypothetical protein